MKALRKVWLYYLLENIFASLCIYLCCIMPAFIFANSVLSTVEKFVFSAIFLYAPYKIGIQRLLLFVISVFYLGGWSSAISTVILLCYLSGFLFGLKCFSTSCELGVDKLSAGIGVYNFLFDILAVFGALIALTSGVLRDIFIVAFAINILMTCLIRRRYLSPTATIHAMISYYSALFLMKHSKDSLVVNMQRIYYNIGDRKNYFKLVHELYPSWTDDQILSFLNSTFDKDVLKSYVNLMHKYCPSLPNEQISRLFLTVSTIGDYSPQWLVAAIIERELGPQDKTKYLKGVLSNAIKS